MLSKKASLLLLIGIFTWLLNFIVLEIAYAVVYDAYRNTLLSWTFTAICILVPVSFIPLAVIGLKRNFQGVRNSGIFIAVVNGLWLAYLLYSNIDFLSRPNQYDMQNPPSMLFYFAREWIALLPSISGLLFGIALAGSKTKRRKRAAVWLVAGGLVYFSSHLGFCLQSCILHITSSSEPESWWMTAGLICTLIKLLYPVGLIAAGISFLKNAPAADLPDTDLLDTPAEELPAPQPATPRVVDWFESYLLSGIPILGPIFLFIWGIDHSKRIRRNWALTYFMAGVARALLNLIFVVPYFIFPDSGRMPGIGIDEGDYLTFAWTLIFLLILACSTMLIVHFIYKPDRQQDPGDPNPSIADWVSNFLILAVPVVGLICLIVWAIDNRNEIVRRWAIARLLWGAVMLGFSFYLFVWMMEVIRIKSQLTFFQF